MSGILACTRSGLNKEAKPVKAITKYHEAVPVIVGSSLIRIVDTDRVSYTSDLDKKGCHEHFSENGLHGRFVIPGV